MLSVIRKLKEEGMDYNIEPSDFVEMNQHFQSRADSIKSAMLTVVPWMLTVAAGLISFGVKEAFFGTAAASAKLGTAIILGTVSFIISCIALFITKEFCDHIELNWARSKKAIKLLRENKSTTPLKTHPYDDLIQLNKHSKEFKELKMAWILKLIYGLVFSHILAALVLIIYSIVLI